MPNAQLDIDRLHLRSRDGLHELPPLTWRAPTSGLIRLDAPAPLIMLLSQALRRDLSNLSHLSGGLHIGHLDWRIAPPTLVLNAHAPTLLHKNALLNLATQLPPSQLARILDDPAQLTASLQPLLAQEPTLPYPLDAPISSLSPDHKLLLAIRCAQLQPHAALLVLDLDPNTHPLSLQALRSIAQQELVMLTCAASSSALPDPINLLDHLCPPPSPPPTPRWLTHIIPHHLAASPRPGSQGPLDDYLLILRQHHITHIINMEEQIYYEAPSDITLHHFPTDDMTAPSIDFIYKTSELINELYKKGESVVVHCKAGLGRTGTVLGACLISRGYSYAQALMLLRMLNPHFIQCEAQHELLKHLARQPRST